MNRLIVFGCSNTYGHGLPDCPTGLEKPSSFGWPSLLADELGIECINESKPGAGNKHILLDLLNFSFEKDDLVITLWSHHHRGYIFDNPKEARSIAPYKESSEEYYMIHPEYDMCVDTTLYIHHAQKYLDSLELNNFNFYFDIRLHSHLIHKKNIVNIDAEFVPFKRLKVDIAEDNSHPGIESHKNISKFILNKINIHNTTKFKEKIK